MSDRFLPAICQACNRAFQADKYNVAIGRGKFCSRSCVKTVDMVGKTFGRLTVLARAGARSTYVVWRCRCECGVEKEILGNALRNGGTVSCGCYMRQAMGDRFRTHGKTHSRTWASWEAMRQRCELPTDPSYDRYGGRGISVCERWASFELFYADMGERPPGMTLDRVNVNGNYCLSNCKWSTPTQQSRNKRTNKTVTHNGETLCLSEWAERAGLRPRTFAQRLRYGWPFELALATPATKSNSRIMRGAPTMRIHPPRLKKLA